MSLVVTFLLTVTIAFLVLFSLGRGLITTYGRVVESWMVVEERSELQARTALGASPSQWAGEESTVTITVSNTGRSPLADFDDWDLVIEVQRDPGLDITYLDYAPGAPLGANQWTVEGIYRDAMTLAPETADPGVLNPGEELVILAKPDPAVVLGTFDRMTLSTPNGVTATVIFEIIITPTPTP